MAGGQGAEHSKAQRSESYEQPERHLGWMVAGGPCKGRCPDKAEDADQGAAGGRDNKHTGSLARRSGWGRRAGFGGSE